MKKILVVMIFLSTVLVSGYTYAAKGSTMKCWTNKEGVRECGDRIPPEYAQQGSETLNAKGITVETKERALTKEELAEKQRIEEEEAKRQAEKEKRLEEQQAYDRVLLATYLSEAEITTARDRKLVMIDGNIEIAKLNISKLEKSIKDERRKAANYERRGKEVPEAIKKQIASLERQINNKEQYIKSKEGEKENIKAKADKDLQRFREIKGIKK